MLLMRFSTPAASSKITVTRILSTQVKPVADGASSNQKEAVRELRKRTGYSFSHIKKALEKHSYDIAESEKWLRAEAKRLGWEKATGLSARVSKQGLIGILNSNNGLAMVELNCETDFVAKNKRFHNLLASICQSVVNTNTSQPDSKRRWAELNVSSIAAGKATNGSSIADLIASEVGHIGENIQLRRGIFWARQGHSNSAVAFMTHPVSTMPPVVETDVGPLNVGKYAAVVEAERVLGVEPIDSEIEQLSLDTAAAQLAQHIIGLNPERVNPEKRDESVELNDIEKAEQKARDDRALVNQTFVLDEDITVGEFLEEQAVKVVDFIRFEVGEQSSEQNNSQ